MADYQFYPLGITAEKAKIAIDTAAALAETPGMIYADGSGNVRTAEPGNDYGFPVLYGNGVPNAYTAGNTGQLYFNLAATSSPYIYVCVDYTNRGYQWKVLGDPGDSFVIYGYYQTLDDLRYGVQNPQPGMAYGVGTAAPYTIYIYDGVTHEWINNGTLGVGGEGGGGSLPPHGTTGQVLVKLSDASGDVGWVALSINSDMIAAQSITAEKLAEQAVSTDYTATIAVNAWTGDAAPYTASVTVNGITAADKPFIDLVPSSTFATAETELEAWGMVYRAITAENTVTFYATEKPTVALNVQMKVVRK